METILDGVHVFHIYLVSFFKKIFLTNITSCWKKKYIEIHFENEETQIEWTYIQGAPRW